MSDPTNVEAGSVTATAQTGVRNAVGNVTGVLAIIGAFAAMAQIWDVFSKNEPDLSAELHSSASFIPEGSRVSLSIEEGSIWKISKNDAIRHYCDRRKNDGKVNFFRDDDNCKIINNIITKIDRSAHFGDRSVSRSEIGVKNSGSDAATGLKMRISHDGHALVRDQSDKIVVDKDVAIGDTVQLPSLNPSESLKIILDTSIPSYSSTQSIVSPIITYSRGKVSISKYRAVSPFFAGLADMLDGIPKFLLAILFVVVSFIVSAATILLVGAVNAIIKGRSINSVFETGPQPPAK